MTIQTIRSDFESQDALGASSERSRLYFQVSTGDSMQVVERIPPAAASAGGCLIYRVVPVVQTHRREQYDAFESLAAEFGDATEVIEGRQWVAAQYGEADLAAIRLDAGLSQAQLASRCDMEQPHVSRYESGKHEPSISIASKLSSALGVSMEAFFNAWQVSRSSSAKVTK
jgi:ribosome-binding protein aMBF1 (putative translation factor)